MGRARTANTGARSSITEWGGIRAAGSRPARVRRVPCPRALSMCRLAPTAMARSRMMSRPLRPWRATSTVSKPGPSSATTIVADSGVQRSVMRTCAVGRMPGDVAQRRLRQAVERHLHLGRQNGGAFDLDGDRELDAAAQRPRQLAQQLADLDLQRHRRAQLDEQGAQLGQRAGVTSRRCASIWRPWSGSRSQAVGSASPSIDAEYRLCVTESCSSRASRCRSSNAASSRP